MIRRRRELFMQGKEFSSSAQLVIDRMIFPNTTFQNAIATFVDTNVLNGNWPDADNPGSGLTDEFYYSGGIDVSLANSFIGWIGKTATNNGTTKVNNGWSGDGITNFINTNFNPNTDGVNYTQNDAALGVYVKVFPAQTKSVFGAFDGANRIRFANIVANNNISHGLNGGLITSGIGTGQVVSDSSYELTRNGTTVKILENNIQLSSIISASTGIPSLPLYLFARNNAGVDQLHCQATLSAFRIGAEIGFDHAGWESSLNTLLTTMGV